jgi:alpha-tubulin suppressor-like RCC1 family protein
MGQGHENVLKAVKRVPLKHVTCIAAGGSYSLAQTEDGTLYSWGKNYDGQLGQGHSIHKSSPSPVQFPPEAGEITGFGCCCDHAFAITTRGVLYLWGSGTEGRLGNGAERSLHSPTAIEGMKFTLPKSYLYILWKPIFRWLFLGRGTPESPFSDFPVEVVYQFVVALF